MGHRLRSPSVALTAGGWIIGLAVTALILGTPYLGFGYQNRSLHLVLDTVDGCVAVLVAYLLYGRFARTWGLQELLLAQGFLLLAAAGVGQGLLLNAISDFQPGTLDIWIPLTIRLAGVGLVAGAAMVGFRRVRRGGLRWAWLGPLLLIALIILMLWIERDRLPVALEIGPPPSAQRPMITGHPVLVVAHALAALCLAAASVRYTAQAARRRDELVRWLGPACALGACARLNYVLFPSIYTDWIYTGDVLRTTSYLVLLIGAAREIAQFWAAQARTAVLEDRQRLARELHDGVVQELTFIQLEARSSALDTGRIIGASERGLAEVRAAIDALGRTADEPLSFVLHRAASEVTERYAGNLEVDLDDSVTADSAQRHALVRITREAVSNALRHGEATRVSIRLLRDRDLRRLVVSDDGKGFDVSATRQQTAGYGLTSMLERAHALPGELNISSSPGHGTEIGVSW